MARAIHWQIPFVSFNETVYTLNIYDEDYQGNIIVLTGSSTPFETDEDNDDDAFKAIRTQSGNIRIVARYESDLDVIRTISGKVRYVALINATNQIIWHGYIQPQTFSQSWAPMPYEIAIPVESCLTYLQNIDYEPQKDNITVKQALQNIFSNIPNFESIIIQNGTVDVLNSQFNDSVFISEDEVKVARLGKNANLTPPEQKTDCYEVLTYICEFFGLTLRENGNSFVFTYPGNNNGFTVVSSSGTSSRDHSSKNLPQVMSTNNEESFLDGRRFINITENPKPEGTVIDTDIRHYDDTGSAIVYESYSDIGSSDIDIAKDYLDQPLVKSYQWKLRTAELVEHVCLFGETDGGNTVCGGNILRVIQSTPYSSRISSYDDNAKNCFGILNASGIPGDQKYSAIDIQTSRVLHGRDYPKGMKLTGNLECGTSSGWTGNGSLYVQIKWGNKFLYYPSNESRAPYWVDTDAYIRLSGDKIHRGFMEIDEGGGTIVRVRIKDYMLIPTDDSLEGVITVRLFASSTGGYVLVSELELSAIGDNKVLFDPCIDLSHNYFRENIGIYSETYNRDLFFCSRMHEEQTGDAFMRDSNNIVYQGQPETELLNRLKTWYSRSIKQITVDIDDTNYSPLDAIVVENETFTIISSSRNYIDNTVKLQLQLNP